MENQATQKKQNILSKFRQWRDKKIQLDTKKSILVLLILSLLTVVLQVFAQNGLNIMAYIGYGSPPWILLFNLLPIFLVMLLGYFLFNRIWAGFLLSNLPLTVALIINEYKIYFRDEPFKPVDVLLGGEATNILQNYKLEFNARVVILAVVMILLFTVVLAIFRNKKAKVLFRVTGIVVTVACMLLSYRFIYQNEEMYKEMPSYANIYYDVSSYNYKGFTYSFLANISTVIYSKPDGYSEEKVEEILQPYEQQVTADAELPNVIAIMSEAFFDPQVGSKVEFYEGMNPLPNLNETRQEGYYGNIIVPGFAGSTASTEFEFLTGANISLISDTMPVVYKSYINRDVYGLPRLFQDKGYDTLAIHPGHRWFYNRGTVYERMGFDRFITMEDLPDDVEQVNYYISDNVTADLIIDNYQEYLQQGNKNGYFNFTVTIQNHGPYREYATDLPPRYVRPDGISDENYHIINNYMDGLYDADALLGKVKTFLKTVDEPTVLVFFGDHLPYFDADFVCYDYLGYDVNSTNLDSIQNRYKIPYVIWCNDAAKTMAQENGTEVKTGQGQDISSNYLASEMFACIGVQPSPFFAFVDRMKQELPVISPLYCVSGGEVLQAIPNAFQKNVSDYKILQYYNLQKFYKFQ